MGKRRVDSKHSKKPINTTSDPKPQEQPEVANEANSDESEEELSNLTPLLSDLNLDEVEQKEAMEVDAQTEEATEEFNPRIKEFEPQPIPTYLGLSSRAPTEAEVEQQRKAWAEKIKEPALELESWQQNKAFLEAQRYTPEEPTSIKPLAFLFKPVDDFDYAREENQKFRDKAIEGRKNELKDLPNVASSLLKDKTAVRELRKGINRGYEAKSAALAEQDQQELAKRKSIFKQ